MNARLERKSDPTARALANRRALTHLFREFERVRAERDAADARMSRFVEAIQLLLGGLSEIDRQEYSRRFEEIHSGTQNRGGEVFGNVIALFKHDPRNEWTIGEVQEALEKKGTPPDSKALYNTIAYLAKTGRLRRVSRGRYTLVDIGAGIEMEDIDDGTSKVTEHD